MNILIHADWLEEQGLSDRANFIRSCDDDDSITNTHNRYFNPCFRPGVISRSGSISWSHFSYNVSSLASSSSGSWSGSGSECWRIYTRRHNARSQDTDS